MEGKNIAYVALAGVGAYAAYKLFSKPKPVEPGEVTKISVEYSYPQGIPIPGGQLQAKITWRNNGSTTIAPTFRLGIGKTGLFDTQLEVSKTSPSAASGASVTFTMNSRTIPPDWAPGDNCEARLVLLGQEGAWDNHFFQLAQGESRVGWVQVSSPLFSTVAAGSTVPLAFALHYNGLATTLKWTYELGTGSFTPQSGLRWEGELQVNAAGAEVTYNVQSTLLIPASTPAKTYGARIRILSSDGSILREDPDANALTVSGAGEVGTVELLSVSYSSPRVGTPVIATVVLKNASTAGISPILRCDLRNDSQWFATWREGTWTTFGTVPAGATFTVLIQSIIVPSDWAGGSLSARLMLEGVSGTWDGSLRSGLTVGGGTSKYKVGDRLQIGTANIYLITDIVTVDGVLWYVFDGSFRVEVSLVDSSSLWHKV